MGSWPGWGRRLAAHSVFGALGGVVVVVAFLAEGGQVIVGAVFGGVIEVGDGEDDG